MRLFTDTNTRLYIIAVLNYNIYIRKHEERFQFYWRALLYNSLTRLVRYRAPTLHWNSEQFWTMVQGWVLARAASEGCLLLLAVLQQLGGSRFLPNLYALAQLPPAPLSPTPPLLLLSSFVSARERKSARDSTLFHRDRGHTHRLSDARTRARNAHCYSQCTRVVCLCDCSLCNSVTLTRWRVTL